MGNSFIIVKNSFTKKCARVNILENDKESNKGTKVNKTVFKCQLMVGDDLPFTNEEEIEYVLKDLIKRLCSKFMNNPVSGFRIRNVKKKHTPPNHSFTDTMYKFEILSFRKELNILLYEVIDKSAFAIVNSRNAELNMVLTAYLEIINQEE